MLPGMTHEEWCQTLEGVVEETLAAAGVDVPPVDAMIVAKNLGMTVVLDSSQANRGRRFSTDSAARSGTVVVRKEPRPERWQWTVAHEIGESCAGTLFGSLGADAVEVSPWLREKAANHFARHLLLPSQWFEPAAREHDWDLFALKGAFEPASHELIARRMLDFSVPVVITIFDQQRVTFRRSNVPGRALPIYTEESKCWQQVHATNEPHVELAPRRVQGWPIHEPDWRREILRTEMDVEMGDFNFD